MILLDKELSKDPAELASVEEAIEIIGKLEWELNRSSLSGIGLAAPQIGINKAVAIIRVPNPYDPSNPVHCINLVNPKLIDAHDVIQYNEGCLSFPGLYAKTIRYNEIIIETMSDYEYYSEQINAKRYNRTPNKMPLLVNKRREITIGETTTELAEIRRIDQLVSVCVQHEFSHLLGLTMFDFAPKEVGRNEQCPCEADKKNKKCHNYDYYNINLRKLFKPNYRGA